MATHAPLARQPFGELNSSRIQQLASAKNRQNGLLTRSSPMGGKADISFSKSASTTTKRTFALSSLDDFDSENVDPAALKSPSKKSKGDAPEKTAQPFSFSLSTTKEMPPPSFIPSKMSTPAKANTSSPRAPLTAPAGRSPRRKIIGIGKSRRTSAPFTRIDPPFATRGSGSATLPFSLDAALNGTFSSTVTSSKPAAGATVKESMPNSWFFDVYVDTAEEESTNLMEHSALNLDLSSDDETSLKDRADRGKENTPPEGYNAPMASNTSLHRQGTATRTGKTDIIRKKLTTNDMDDGERSPLSDLETDSFFPEGLSKESCVIVGVEDEKEDHDLNSVSVSAIHHKVVSKKAEQLSMPKITATKDSAKDEIVVFEDGSDDLAAIGVEASISSHLDGAGDENAAPKLVL